MTPTTQRQEHPCDLCGAREALEVPHARHYTQGQPLHICRACGFVYVKHRRTAEAIARSWSEEIFGEGYTAALPAVQARHTFVAEFVRQSVGLEGKTVLDIGAGEGAFLERLRGTTRDVEVYGVEPSKQNCARMAKAGLPCFEGTIEDFLAAGPKDAPRPDVVTILWTLENCQSCRTMLDAAWELLKPGGHIVVATGSRLLVPFKKPLQYYLGPRDVDTHAFRFSANTLRAFLATSGFEVTAGNRFIDNDVLCMVGRKLPRKDPDAKWQGDDPLQVWNFFERWHADTQLYYRDA